MSFSSRAVSHPPFAQQPAERFVGFVSVEGGNMFGMLDPKDEKSFEAYRRMALPMLDQQVRQALMMIWQALPPERQNVDEVEKEFRRIADRAIADLREDSASFGI
jgi:hypothetical protein